MGDVAIKMESVSKVYKLYNSSGDRLKEVLNIFGRTYYREFYALKNINLEIRKGEIIGVIGKNGSGKSTLLKLITGVLSPNDGHVRINGKISALLELGAGFNPEFTGMQNIYFYGTIVGLSEHQVNEKLDDILNFADIGQFIDQPLKTYSSGMKSRLAFAVAVHVDPEILILDEVLSVGDYMFQRKCFAKMEEFIKSGKTIIYVSHNMDSISGLCTRAVLINQGTIECDGKPKKVVAAYKRLLYRGPDLKADVSNATNVSEDKFSEENFDYGLKTEVIVKENESAITIDDYHIVNDEGKRVNLLKMGGKYVYVYRVKFAHDNRGVLFGAGIRNVQGVPLSWIISDEGETIDQDRMECRVEWSFTCRLYPGIYYTTAGIRDINGGILRQELDTLAFKVESTSGNNGGGIFDSSWQCDVFSE